VQRGLFFYVGNGRSVCHPTYIADAVDGLLRCLAQGRAGEIYHITGSHPVTFRELGETIAAAAGVRSPWLAVPKPLAWLGALALEGVAGLLGRTPPLSRTGIAFFSENRRFSWQKAQRELGYMPQFDLAAGVAETVAWYRQQGLLD
jgi:UDP-glucose 4-epimerase